MTQSWDQRLARAAVRPLARTAVSPNHVTALGLVVGLAAAALFATGSAPAADVGAALFMLYLLIDHADGELARLTGKATPSGQRFDSLGGAVITTTLFVGLGVGLSERPLGAWALALGLAAGLANIPITAVRLQMRRRFGSQAVAHPGRFGVEIEDFLYLIGPATWLGALPYFLVLFGLGTFGYLGWIVREFLRRSASPGP
ncbi:MAG: CDP-alcohol phosphatidyltransferase family protein [Candidatus Rokubacteria bacterium]|nr:CDP-alcohol phosphatidyltransferase family protein [Candidatus Rokubacteria bacterium]